MRGFVFRFSRSEKRRLPLGPLGTLGALLLLSPALAIVVPSAACDSGGNCLRMSDCDRGYTCVEGTCLSDTAIDGPGADAAGMTDGAGGAADSSVRDASAEASSPASPDSGSDSGPTSDAAPDASLDASAPDASDSSVDAGDDANSDAGDDADAN